MRVVRGQRDHHIQLQWLIQTILTRVSRQQATTAVILIVIEVVPGVIQPGTTGDIVPFHCVQVSVYISLNLIIKRVTFATYKLQKQLK